MNNHEGRDISRSRLPLKLFISYSHSDERLRDQLANHLAALKRDNLIADWHDRRIVAGENWAEVIDHHLSAADLILLLVSPSFVASPFCYDRELQRALERHAAGEARVTPVILRPVDWRSLPFGNLQALPKDGKPVTRWSNRDSAFLDIAKGLRSTADELFRLREGKQTMELDEPTFLLHQISHLEAELVKQENLGDESWRKDRLRMEIDRLRHLYRGKYGKDLPEYDK